jgi:hypothetical protein
MALMQRTFRSWRGRPWWWWRAQADRRERAADLALDVELREDGSYELREDGGYELKESA